MTSDRLGTSTYKLGRRKFAAAASAVVAAIAGCLGLRDDDDTMTVDEVAADLEWRMENEFGLTVHSAETLGKTVHVVHGGAAKGSTHELVWNVGQMFVLPPTYRGVETLTGTIVEDGEVVRTYTLSRSWVVDSADQTVFRGRFERVNFPEVGRNE